MQCQLPMLIGSGGAIWATETELDQLACSLSSCRPFTGTMFQLVGGTAAAVLIFGIPGALLLKAATESGSEGRGGGRRALLLAAGIALELITLTSWGVTLYDLMGQH